MKKDHLPCFDLSLLSSSVPEDLPAEATAVGFKKTGFLPFRSRPFTLQSGPLRTAEGRDPLSAWSLFFNKVMKDAILAEARSQAKKTQNLIDITEANLMKYVMFVIASGIASFSRRKHGFSQRENSGLTENSFFGKAQRVEGLMEVTCFKRPGKVQANKTNSCLVQRRKNHN